jgi:HEAT repeat protein
LLLPLATDADWQIRYRLVQALGHLDDPRAQDVIKALAQDEMQAVAEEAKLHLAS